LKPSSARERVDELVETTLLPHVLNVDERRGAGDRDRLFERATRSSAFHRRGEAGGQVDAVALSVLESASRSHRVGARPQVDDIEAAFAVGDRGAHLLDRAGLVASTVTPGNTALT